MLLIWRRREMNGTEPNSRKCVTRKERTHLKIYIHTRAHLQTNILSRRASYYRHIIIFQQLNRKYENFQLIESIKIYFIDYFFLCLSWKCEIKHHSPPRKTNMKRMKHFKLCEQECQKLSTFRFCSLHEWRGRAIFLPL